MLLFLLFHDPPFSGFLLFLLFRVCFINAGDFFFFLTFKWMSLHYLFIVVSNHCEFVRFSFIGVSENIPRFDLCVRRVCVRM